MNKKIYPKSQKIFEKNTKPLITIILISCLFFIQSSYAQQYYPTFNYKGQQQLPPSGMIGTLYNSSIYTITGAETFYHNNQNLYGMIYLPYILDEYQFEDIYPKPFDPMYTTGIALCAVRAPALGLYAPTEVVAEDKINILDPPAYYPFASTIPLDANMLTYNGPFNKLPHLNQHPENFTNTFNSVCGVSVLEAMQKFNAFTHELFEWDGMDEAGNACLTSLISYKSPTGFVLDLSNLQMHMIFNVFSPNHPQISRDIIGHEISHGILIHSLGPPLSGDHYLDDNEYLNPNVQPEMDAMTESFCDIMGLSFDNYHSLGKFEFPNWTFADYLGESDINSANRPFDNPKSFGYPSAYKGQFYTNPGNPFYDPHYNGQVMNYWFHLINKEKGGFVDDLVNKPFIIHRLIPHKRDATYKLALKLVFKAFTEKLKYNSTFHDAREATLQVIQELGHPVGTHAYIQVMNAWNAVDVGGKWNPFANNPECVFNKEADNWFNGTVKFHALRTTLNADLVSEPLYFLKNCTELPGIETSQYNPFTETVELAMDGDHNGVYQAENNSDLSKSSIGVHWATELSNRWFNNYFKLSGPKEDGTVPIKNVLGNPNFTESAFNIQDQTYYYPFAPAASDLDAVSQIYFQGINHFAKADANLVNDYAHPEWEAIRNGLGQIFALNIKNDFRANLPVPQSRVWTLGEAVPDNPVFLDFSKPESSLQPKLWKGQHWNTIAPALNASLLDFWYYLLVHGTVDYGPQGYINEKNHHYFIFPINNDLALELIWKAYSNVPLFSTFEEFRLATIQALQTLGYGVKSNEAIALYDAWAAVMDLPDYASTLKHEPAEGETIYPWAAKVGVEVEYPLLESSRIFQVSESATFNVLAAPVYSFFNYTAPDMNTGMVYGRVNLLPGKTYFVRSHLYQSGSKQIGVAGGCDVSEDPALCLSLQGKEKWTPTYSFQTASIELIDQEMSPAAGSTAPAWDTPFSWGSILGANGYLMKIGDDAGVVPMGSAAGTLALELPYDEDQAVVYQNLALSMDKNYTYTLAAKAKLGSEEGAKAVPDPVLNYTQYIPLTPEEKVAFPDAYSTSTEPITFKTDIPKMLLGDPSDGKEVPMVGQLSLKASPKESRVDFFRGRIYYQQDGQQPNDYQDLDVPEMAIDIQELPFLKDGHTYGWTFSAKKNAVPPFIPNEETGEMPVPKHFVVQKKLIPQPQLQAIDCVPDDFSQVLKWKGVPGAKAYEYTVRNLSTNQLVVPPTVTGALFSTPLAGISDFPTKYEWSVAAGIQDAEGKWNFGQPAFSTYNTAPKLPSAMSPDNQEVAMEPNQSVTLKWTNVSGVSKCLVSLFKIGPGGLTTIFEDKLVVQDNFLVVGNQQVGVSYQWEIKSLGDNGCPSGSRSATYQIAKQPIKHEDGGTPGTGGGDPKPGSCPGYFQVSITNSDKIQLSILHHVLGSPTIEEGSNDLNDGTFQPYIWDGGFFYPTGYTANDEIVLHIKVKSLFEDWINLDSSQIPEVTIVTSGGVTMHYKFNFSDWQLDKEIWMGSYKCSEN